MKTFDTILNVVLLTCLIALVCQLFIIMDIGKGLTDVGDCLEINGIFYCRYTGEVDTNKNVIEAKPDVNGHIVDM